MNVHLSNFEADLRRVVRACSTENNHLHVTSRMKLPQRARDKTRPVRDLLGARVVYHPADKGRAAYHIAREITRRFQGARITRDYVRSPKPLTNYQSLHMEVPYLWYLIEVQVRDSRMHDRAQHDQYVGR